VRLGKHGFIAQIASCDHAEKVLMAIPRMFASNCSSLEIGKLCLERKLIFFVVGQYYSTLEFILTSIVNFKDMC
jgi:hypothetical protein